MNNPDKGKGIMFDTPRKKGSKQPTLKGKINIDGKVHDIVGWQNYTKKDKIYYISISIDKPFEPSK